MPEGKIQRVMLDRGFGFIASEASERDLFFHFSDTDIPLLGLRPGLRVSFDLVQNDRGPAAVKVRSIGDPLPAILEAEGEVKFWNHEKSFGFVGVTNHNDVFISRNTVFSGGVEPCSGDVVRVKFYLSESSDNPQGTSLEIVQLKEWKPDQYTPLFRFAEMGPRPQWADQLAALAETENWDYRREPTGGKPILDSYLRYTYVRLEEENKILVTGNESHAAFNTGLVTTQQEEIFAFFARNSVPGRQKWQLIGFRKRSDRDLLSQFGGGLPELANYFEDPGVLLYDRRLPLHINVDHVLENLDRFPTRYQDNPYMARTAVLAAEPLTKARVARNYKTAIPQWYRDKHKNKASIQLLIPLCFEAPDVADLALVVERESNYYRGNTVLTLDMAYKNARLLARPDSEWLIP